MSENKWCYLECSHLFPTLRHQIVSYFMYKWKHGPPPHSGCTLSPDLEVELLVLNSYISQKSTPSSFSPFTPQNYHPVYGSRRGCVASEHLGDERSFLVGLKWPLFSYCAEGFTCPVCHHPTWSWQWLPGAQFRAQHSPAWTKAQIRSAFAAQDPNNTETKGDPGSVGTA